MLAASAQASPEDLDRAVRPAVTLETLRTLEPQIQAAVRKARQAVVAVRLPAGSGSGVLVGDEGYVLTAGHVSGVPGQICLLQFPDGRQVTALSLGRHLGTDAGLLKIQDPGPWKGLAMAPRGSASVDRWVVATGHPGGPQPQRGIVVRAGQLLDVKMSTLQSDCTLIGGDSGGALLDLNGRVVGIHSRIGGPAEHNFHTPIDVFHERWARLTGGEQMLQAFLGIGGMTEARARWWGMCIPAVGRILRGWSGAMWWWVLMGLKFGGLATSRIAFGRRWRGRGCCWRSCGMTNGWR